MLGNAVPERTANFGWPAVAGARFVCLFFYFFFFSWSFLKLSTFSSFSNNAAQHDLPNSQSVSPVQSSQSVCQSLSQSSQSVRESINQLIQQSI